MTRESRSTGRAERTSVREHVRPSQTHAEEVVANAPGENFPVALRLLPARHRRHLTNLYFFARLTDDRGDEAGLAAAADALSGATDPSLQADAAELAARMALRRGNLADARQAAERAVALRQQTLDYRGLARALALGGEAAKRAGDAKAASDLYLRAGRSAAAQGDENSARRWLKEAASLATEDSVRNAATELLGKLGS